MKLFEITAEYQRLTQLVEDSQLDEIPAEIASLLDGIDAAESTKADGYYAMIRRFEMEASAAKEEAERYAMAANARANAVARMKAALKEHLQATGRTELVTSTGRKFKVCANGGKVPIEVADGIDLNTIRQDLVRVSKSIDVDRVRACLQDGESLPWASLGERGTHLRVS